MELPITELQSIFESDSGLSLQESIYKTREWAHISSRGGSSSSATPRREFSARLLLLAQFVDDMLKGMTPAARTPTHLTGSKSSQSTLYNVVEEDWVVVARPCQCNVFVMFSSLVDVFCRAGSKRLAFIRKEEWCQRFESLLLCIEQLRENGDDKPQEAGSPLQQMCCAYRGNDVHVAIKQLRMLQSRMVFSHLAIESWISKFSNLLEHKQTMTAKSEGQKDDTKAFTKSGRTGEDGEEGGTKRRKASRQELSSEPSVRSAIREDWCGGLAVYRVCYLIGELCARLNSPVVLPQLAQEIFHSFIISSSPLPYSTTSATASPAAVSQLQIEGKRFATYMSRCSPSREGAPSPRPADLVIRPYSSSLIAHAIDSDDLSSDFWQYPTNAEIGSPPLAERKCEKLLSAAAVAAILLATKVITDTRDACSRNMPRLSALLKALKALLSSSRMRALLFDNTNNAFHCSSDALKEKIFELENEYLHHIQYDVSHWRGTVASTLEMIAVSNPGTVTEAMVQEAAALWNKRIFWFTNVSGMASKTELGLALLAMGRKEATADTEMTELPREPVAQWCESLQVPVSTVNALVRELMRIVNDVAPAIERALSIKM